MSAEDLLKPLPGAAGAFCRSAEFKTLSCDLASPLEVQKALMGRCWTCGTIWTTPPRPPQTFLGHVSYYQYTGRPVSIACKGLLRFRIVYKVLAGEDCPTRLHADALSATVVRDISKIRRCEIEYDSSQAFRTGDEFGAMEDTEVKVALNSKEVNCKVSRY
jgi:hypothetical protein